MLRWTHSQLPRGAGLVIAPSRCSTDSSFSLSWHSQHAHRMPCRPYHRQQSTLLQATTCSLMCSQQQGSRACMLSSGEKSMRWHSFPDP